MELTAQLRLIAAEASKVLCQVRKEQHSEQMARLRKEIEQQYESDWKAQLLRCAQAGETECFIVIEKHAWKRDLNLASADCYPKANLAVEFFRDKGFSACRTKRKDMDSIYTVKSSMWNVHTCWNEDVGVTVRW